MEIGQPIEQMVLVQLALSMPKNENRPFLISLYKTQVQVDQRSPHLTRYTEIIRRESRENLRTHRQRRIFPEQNTNSLLSKIKNQEMGPQEIANFP